MLLSLVTYCQYPNAATIKKNKIRIIGLDGLSGTVYRLYDEHGMGVKGSYMDEEFKKTEWENKIFYNEKSLPDSIHSTGYSKSKTYYKYAPDGSYTTIEIERTSSDTSFYEKDHKIKERRGKSGSKTKYEYNTKRQLIKKTETNGGGKSITSYVYNAAGLLQSEKTTGANTGSAVYTYDKKGLLIKEVNDYGTGSKMTTSYFYKYWETLPVQSQVKTTNLPPSFVLNESTVTINGTSFNAQQMLVEKFFKLLGQPDKIDTLTVKQLNSRNSLEMATMNKYNTKGVLLAQGRQTSRINVISIYLNPDKQSKFIDYVRTPFTGKLTMLGLIVDSNTTVKQLNTAFEKYGLEVSDQFRNASMTIYDKKTSARLLEVSFYLTASLEKIEYLKFRCFPNEPLKKLKIVYRDKQLYIDKLLLDTSSGTTTELIKVLGSPNCVADFSQNVNGKTITAKKYFYNSIQGISFIENPANNSLMELEMDFLSIRKKSILANPLIDVVINNKNFEPENAVPSGPQQLKSVYALDSIKSAKNSSGKENIFIAIEKNAYLFFEFTTGYQWDKRVYYLSYELKQPASMPVIETAIQNPAPEFFINNGKVWLQLKGKSIYLDAGVDAKSKFFASLGRPSKILNSSVSEFAEHGFRVWVNSDGLEELLVFLTPIKNAYSGLEASPGVFKGRVEIEGKEITQEMTIDDINSLLPAYNFKKAYSEATEVVYIGKNNGVKMHLTFHKSSGKLSNFSFSRK